MISIKELREYIESKMELIGGDETNITEYISF